MFRSTAFSSYYGRSVFFPSTTSNKAIGALFHPQRDGSISCASASDPCYLRTPDSELNLMH